MAMQRMMNRQTFWDEAMDLKYAVMAVFVSRHPKRPPCPGWLEQPACA